MKSKKIGSRNVLIKDYTLFDEGFLMACDAVAETMGGNGMLAIVDKKDSAPSVTKDGVTLMRSIRFEQKSQNYGALQAIAGAARTLEHSGDSTSATAVLMAAYLRGMKRNRWNKKVEEGVHSAVNEAYKYLSELATSASRDDLKQIAKVSLNNDEYLSTVLMEAFDYAGTDGIVEATIKKGAEVTTFVKQEGMKLPTHGYTSPYFANNQDKQLCFEGEGVSVLCCAIWEYNQTVINQIQLFYQSVPRSTPLTIFIEKSSSDFLEKLKGIKEVGFNVNLVAINGYDEFEGETLLKDIATLTGGLVYNPRDPEAKFVFGMADKLVSTVESTNIIVREVPTAFTETLEKLKSSEVVDEARIKRLTTKAAIIEVGGLTLSQQSEIFDRIDDAISSIKTTMAEGFIAGGGTALVYVSGLLNKNLKHKERQEGYNLVKKALKEPMIRILKNSNRYSSKWYQFWKPNYLDIAKTTYGMGYNCTFDEVRNLLDDGIIDSKKSLRIALESATERAIQMFSISVIVHDPEKLEL